MKQLRDIPSGIEADGRWQLAQRIAQSEPFRRAPRVRAFLLFIVERTLLDPDGELNEYQVGVEVFGRSKDFDPSEDSIVRSAARQLRGKLEEYFNAYGGDEKIRIVVAKGGYVPEFVPVAEPWTPSPVALPSPDSSPGSAVGVRVALTAVSALCLVLLLACWYLWHRQPAKLTAPLAPPSRNLIFSVFPRPNSDVNLVLCDAALVVVNGLRSKALSLDEYIRLDDQKPLTQLQGRDLFPGMRLITDFRDMVFAQQLIGLWPSEGHLGLRQSRLMQVRDFRLGNYVLLGGPVSDPWVGLFEKQLNFQFETDPATGRVGIQNRHPRSGEKPFYWTSSEQGNNGISYARIAMVPNLSGSGRVLLISGHHAEGSEGACDAALSAGFFEQVQSVTGWPSPELAGFELLLQASAVNRVVQETKLVAYRVTKR